jgi:3,4-dihydroxy-2-butanone 4-phosphate synthase
MEQLENRRTRKRKVRWQPTLRQLMIQKAVMLYRLGHKEATIKLLEQNGISVYEFLLTIANMEKRSKKSV